MLIVLTAAALFRKLRRDGAARPEKSISESLGKMRTANAITHDVASSLSGLFEVGFALSVSGS